MTWHESCKRGLYRRDTDVQYQDDIYSDSDDRDNQNVDVRRVNHKRFVTEERLQQFGRELRDDITKNVTKSVTENIVKTIRQMVREEIKTAQNYGTQGGTSNKIVTCYACHAEGHISRNCPLKENRNRSISRLDVTDCECADNFICDGAEVADKSEN